MVGLTRKTVDMGKFGSIQHFYKASLGRIKGNVIQALIFVHLLVHKRHSRFLSRENDAFDKQKFLCHLVQMPNCKKWVLQVIEKTKTKHEIELPKFLEP